MARIGVDGLVISPRGKGNARSQRHAVEVVQVGRRLTLDWELRGMPSAARRHRLDAFLTLSERLPPIGGPPTAVWLFESPLHRIRTNRARRAPLWNRGSDLVTALAWKRSLRSAAHVAFGSRATQHEVERVVPGLRSTSVVYPGVPPGFSIGSAPDRGRYVLHLGSDDPRDNTAVAVEACRRVGVRLLVAGGWTGDGAEALGRVSDEELLGLYRGAAAFLDPTLYEGFGYGALEAMACGTPVVTSRATSLPEVVGDAGLLCDPHSPQAFAAALERLLGDQRLADQLRRRGVERAASFTWERTGAGLARALATTLAAPLR